MKWMRWGAYAGMVAALFEAYFSYNYFTGYTFSEGAPLFSSIISAMYSLVYVLYWYGLSRLGTKYNNPSLHNSAIAFIATSICLDILSLAPLLYPPVVVWGSYDMVYLALGTIIAIVTILSGLAVQRLRPQFGNPALWYGIGAMLSGVGLFAGDIGVPSLISLGIALNIALYALGSMLLLKAAKK